MSRLPKIDDIIYLVYDGKVHSQYRGVRAQDLHTIDAREWKFRSIFSYDRKSLDRWTAKTALASGQPSLAGYEEPGVKYGAYTIPLDVDAATLQHAAIDTGKICDFLERHSVPYRLYFSGKKGFHVEFPPAAIDGSGYHEDLADIMREFVRLLAPVIGVDTIDDGIYTRNHKYRTAGCPRESGAHKIHLPDRKFLKAWDRLKQFSMTSAPALPPVGWPKDVTPSKVLSEIWAEAEYRASGLPPVTITSGDHASGGYVAPEYVGGDIEDLLDKLAATRGATPTGRGLVVSCPNPEHADRTPSAIAWPNGYVFCKRCKENFNPAKVGRWVGVHVSRKAESPDKADSGDAACDAVKGGEDDYETLDEARQRVSAEIMDMVKEGRSGVVSVPVGVGKSYGVREALRVTGKSAVYVAPTHEMLSEAVLHYSGHHLKPYFEVEPRYMDAEFPREHSLITAKIRRERNLPPAYDQDTGEYQPVSFYDEAQYRMEALDRSAKEVLARAPFHPDNPQKDASLVTCRFMELIEAVKSQDTQKVQGILGLSAGQTQKIMQTVYAASAHIGLSTMEGMIEGRDLVIIDEDPYDYIRPVDTFNADDLQYLLSDEVCEGRYIYAEDAAYRAAERKMVEERGDAYEAEKVPLRAVFQSLISRGELPPAVRHEGGLEDISALKFPSIIRKDAFAEIFTRGGGEHKVGLHIPEAHEVATRFIQLLTSGDTTDISVFHDDHRGEDHVIVTSKRDLSALDGVPVIVLDASADDLTIDALEYDLGRDLDVISADRVHNPQSKIIHDPERLWAAKSSRRYVAEDEKQLADIRAYIKELDGDDVGLISQKSNAAARYLVGEGLVDEDKFAWYGGLRGLNRLEGVDHLVLLGDPGLPEIAHVVEGARWGVPADETVTFAPGYTGRDYRLNFSTLRPVRGSKGGDFVYKRLILDEIYQAMGRARGLAHDVTIHALCGPDVACSEYKYELKPGGGRAYGPRYDRSALWGLILKTFVSAKKISDRTGVAVRKVRDLITPEVKEARVHFMHDLLMDRTQKEVAELMGCSTRTIRGRLS